MSSFCNAVSSRFLYRSVALGSEAALSEVRDIQLSIAADRGNRECVLSANFRRAVSLSQLGDLGDAAFLFTELAQSIKNEQVWIMAGNGASQQVYANLNYCSNVCWNLKQTPTENLSGD